jgi:hypothetical protein
VEPPLTEDAQGDVEELPSAARSRKARGVGPDRHGQQRTCPPEQETDPTVGNLYVVRARKKTPPTTTRRPAEPFRPLPAQKLGVSLLAVKARRRRYTSTLPPRTGETGW